MKLIDIATTGKVIPFDDLGAFKDLVQEIQKVLGDFGLLDPPADGKFGHVSRWALREAAKALKLPEKTELDADLAKALLSADPAKLFPLRPTDGFASEVAQFMKDRKLWLNRHPDCFNIVYLEGCDTKWNKNGNKPNEFNDVRLLLRVKSGGEPEIVKAWQATTEPGRHYTEIAPLSPLGAARIALGQHKAWVVGLHPSSASANRHEALIQAAEVTVYRDANRDYKRFGDREDTGMFGINQHWGYDLPSTDIQNASAGCLVGRETAGHKDFMAHIKSDARFKENSGYLFISTVIDRNQLN